MPWTDSGTPPLPSIFSVSWNLNYSPASIVSAVTSALGTLMSPSTVSPRLPCTQSRCSACRFQPDPGKPTQTSCLLDCGHSVFGTVYAHDLDLAELTRAVNGRRATDCRRIVECNTPVRSDTPAAYFPSPALPYRRRAGFPALQRFRCRDIWRARP